MKASLAVFRDSGSEKRGVSVCVVFLPLSLRAVDSYNNPRR